MYSIILHADVKLYAYGIPWIPYVIEFFTLFDWDPDWDESPRHRYVV